MNPYWDGLNKSKGESNYNIYDYGNIKIQKQARYVEDSEAIFGIHEEIVTIEIKMFEKRMRKFIKKWGLGTALNCGSNGVSCTSAPIIKENG